MILILIIILILILLFKSNFTDFNFSSLKFNNKFEVVNTFKTYEQMYELLINNDFSFLRREYGTMNYPQIEWMIEYFTEKEEYEKCNFLRNLELPKVMKDKL